jgi:hypothetical protein
LIAVLLNNFGAVFSQENSDWQFRFTRKNCECTVVPFDLQQNLIIIPVFINDSDTLRFVFDSGARYAIVTSLGSDKDLQLNYAKKTYMSGLGRGEDIEALISLRNVIRVGELMLNYQLVGVLLSDIFHLEKQLGTEVHGILGMNIFKELVIKADYSRRKLYFCKNPKKFAKEKAKDFLPLEIINEKPYIQALAHLPDGKQDSVRLLLDTGAGHALMLTLPDTTEWLKNLSDACLGSGLNGQIYGKTGKINVLHFGNIEFQSVPASFPDTLSLRAFYLQKNANGSIGAEIMRRFDWVFDFREQRAYFKPNLHFASPFRVNTSGLEVSKPLKDLPFFWVENVRKNSPAFSAGVREGDQIYALNGKSGKELNMNFIMQTLQRESGAKIKLVIIREGKKIKAEFELGVIELP